jgi:hypothetical protein
MLETWVAELGRWVAKLVARLLATVALWVRIQTSLKKLNGRHKQRRKEWPTHSSPPQNYTKNNMLKMRANFEDFTYNYSQLLYPFTIEIIEEKDQRCVASK